MKTRLLLFLLTSLLFAQDTGEIVMDEIILDNETDRDEIILDDETGADELPPIEKMPEQIGFTKAEYPEEFQRRGIEGPVRLQLLVTETGTVDSAFIVGSLEPTLDSLAREASLSFTFTPAFADGEAVPVFIEYEYQFSLKEIVKTLTEYVNFTGEVIERGTRNKLADVPVVAVFSGEYPSLNVPIDVYLERIGAFEGQELDEGMIVTTTDADGTFQFKSLPAGEVTIKIPHTGYEMYHSIDTIVAGEAQDQRLFLQKISYGDYTVTSYYKGEEKEVSRRQITVNEVKKVAGLGGDALKVVQAMPGVARPSFGNGDVVVRGSYTWDSRFYLDGIEIPKLYHFGGLKSTYNSDAMGGLDFYPGGFGTTYGNAVGGVVDVHAREPKDDRLHGKLDLSTLDGSVMIEGPIVKDKVSFLGTYRRSFIGELYNAVVENSPSIDPGMTMTPFYWDYVGRVDITPNDKHRFAITGFGSYDSVAMIFDNTSLGSDEIEGDNSSIRSKNMFHLAGASWEYKITDNLENKLSLFYSHTDDNFKMFGYARQEMQTNGLRFRDNLRASFSEKVAVNVGTDGYVGNTDLVLDILTEQGMTKDSTEDWHFSNVGVYANLEWTPNDRLLVIPGIRYDYYGSLKHEGSILPEFWEYGDWNRKGPTGDPSFRLTSRFKLREGHVVKGAVGNYNQEPQPWGQAIHKDWGTPTLPTTKATHLVGGYEWDITDLLSLDAQGYFNYQWNIPRQTDSMDIQNASGGDVPNFEDDGKGRTYGLELMLRHHQSERFFGWISYTLSRSERYNKFSDEYELFEKDQTHNLQIVASWRLPRNYEIGGRVQYGTGNPMTEVIGREHVPNDQYVRPIYGKKFGARFDPTFKFDIRFEKKFILRNSILTPYIDIQNALAFLYKSPEEQVYDDYYIDMKTVGMPIIPAIGMSWEF